MHRWEEFPAMRGLWKGYFEIKSKAKRETEIILKNRCFMGRTEWDRAYIRSINPMRIMHFINSPLNIDQFKSSGKEIKSSGGWLTTLMGRMLTETNFKFACVAFGDVNKVESNSDDRITTYVVPGGWEKIGASMHKSLKMCLNLIDEWNPDLIHIHGTESSYGLLTARGIVNRPTVISLQGLLGPCSEWYHFFGNTKFTEVIKMHRWMEFPALRGLLIGYFKLKNMAEREREIIRGNRFFIGRTEWDRAYIETHNSNAYYFYGGEMLRDEFWNHRWDIHQAKRHRIIFTNAGHPRKGAELILEAIKYLKPQYPDIQVAIAGAISRRSGYGRYIRNRISELGNTAIELGQLNATEMAFELCRSHVFVSPSYIDNSPNAVCEAQLLGMPVISSYTGGIPSLITEGQNGLFFPTGDALMLSARLREVFEDDELALKLGDQARKIAIFRHDPNKVIRDVLNVYEDILSRTP